MANIGQYNAFLTNVIFNKAQGGSAFSKCTATADIVTLLAKYNLNVGNYPYGGVATNRQEPNALSANPDMEHLYGGVLFHSTSDESFTAMTVISDLSGYTINQYLINYKNILEEISGLSDIEVTLPGMELFNSGLCSMQTSTCNLTYNTSFWSKIAITYNTIGLHAYNTPSWRLVSLTTTTEELYDNNSEKYFGVRPVIIVPISVFE